eukprot:TRINITY_DN13656_c0_g1_i1.p1 TRINITY_DN13656_c0_g1~~TRINITY_DN13656_c0_g1_i1.p1  ORF type:complete len:261 (-),score=56.14 TRINITY_DN13656_c0_g1_i1:87-869(-)
MQGGKQGVTFQEFPMAQFTSAGPSKADAESFNGFEYVFYSVRIRDAQMFPQEVNSGKARTRAVKLRRDVRTDLALNWQTRGEIAEMPNDVETLVEQEPLPMPPPASEERKEKVVRFSDEVDTRAFLLDSMKHCELCSAHELCLIAFVSRVESAKVSSHAANALDAFQRGLSLRTEVEVQQREEEIVSEDVMIDDDLWSVIDTPSQESAIDESSHAESRRPQRQIKKCFWILDTRRMPEEARNSCESKRWQDQVRQCTAIF